MKFFHNLSLYTLYLVLREARGRGVQIKNQVCAGWLELGLKLTSARQDNDELLLKRISPKFKVYL